ncbi:MAG: bifunctional 5,10-methylenetetrahydrofolate dehydrogenase/5,10-methenyltetrahydrofolate cyclohydrolase [Finegoldia sp.]|nr:bifunctional 5,10-methylenetetrahydrofolate dehydrogenase/5,10-methenyltetrahydrofolate cyclohydrolase [Finegoldia sp.]
MKTLDISDLRKDIGKKIKAGIEELGREVTVATVRIGENPSDISYEKGVAKNCEKLGINHEKVVISEDDAESVIDTIKDLNEKVDGILVFRPFKDKDLENRALHVISPEKDIDAMGIESLARVFNGEDDTFYPATAMAVREIVNYYDFDVSDVVIVNRSLVLGKPLQILFLKDNLTVTMCHSKTKDMKRYTKKADLVVTATGRAKMFDDSYFTKDTYVVDVGVSKDRDGKLSGDVDPDVKVKALVNEVGKITTRVLLLQMVQAALKREKSN